MSSVPSSVVGGCDDPWEELALALCRGAEPAARELVRRQTLVNRLNEVRLQLPKASAEATRAKRELSVAQAEYQRVVEAFRPATIFGLCALVGLIGVALVAARVVVPLGYLIMLAAAAGAVAGAVVMSSKKSAARQVVAAREQEVARAHGLAEMLRKEDGALAEEIQSIRPKAAVRAVGRVYLPTTIEAVGGYDVALDRSGMTPNATFRLADFTYDSTELAAILDAIEGLKHPPEMLQPAPESGDGNVDELFGEEQLLRNTVTRFARFIGSVPTTDVGVPLVPSAEVSRAGFRLDRRLGLPFPGAILESGRRAIHLEAIGRLNDTLGAVRRQGTAPKEALSRAHATIAALLGQYRELRTTSMGQIHEQLLGAMSRSSWCAVHFYCPKSTRNPVWIQRRLGVEIENAHELRQDELMRALTADDEIQSRLDTRPELLDRLDRAWLALDELEQGLEALRAGAAASAAGFGVAAAPNPATYSGTIRGLESQRSQFLRQYRDVLGEIVFGSRRPQLEMSTFARLELDPGSGAWRNETAGTEYRDFDEIECAQVLRLHEDLLFPMWRHLWTEKADFRKSELFRTNEQLLRMSEKESEKLISVGNQFRDDMRTTREVLKQVEGELRGKLDQMRGTRDALVALGLLGEAGAKTLGEESLAALDVGAAAALGHAEVKETMLALEPQAQAERRERAADPIDLVASPSVLFRTSPGELFRARLAPERALREPENTLAERVVVSGMTVES